MTEEEYHEMQAYEKMKEEEYEQECAYNDYINTLPVEQKEE